MFLIYVNTLRVCILGAVGTCATPARRTTAPSTPSPSKTSTVAPRGRYVQAYSHARRPSHPHSHGAEHSEGQYSRALNLKIDQPLRAHSSFSKASSVGLNAVSLGNPLRAFLSACAQAEIGETLKLSCVTPKEGSDIYLLGDNFGGAPTPLKWSMDGGDTTITVPKALTANLPGPGYAFKIIGEPATKC